MSYDELEKQYFIVSQRNVEIEREINSLMLRNTELESTNIISEAALDRASTITENMAHDLQEEVLKVVNLKVQLETMERKYLVLEHKANHPNSFMDVSQLNAETLQSQANNLQRIHPRPHSIHLPMKEFNVPRQQSNIILGMTDEFGMHQSNDARMATRQWHAYAKLGDKIFRYSTQESMLSLRRSEDFGVVLNQMTEGLKETIIEAYVQAEFR